MYNKSCVVVIPIYQEKLSEREEFSLMNTIDIYRDRDIVLIMPRNLNIENYIKWQSDRVKLTLLEEHNFQSAYSYSDLLLTSSFYKQFHEYEYILICHTDAWIFKDELDSWMQQGYDYVGAPLVSISKNPLKAGKTIIDPFGGNGGLSLRKTKKMIEFIENKQHKGNWSNIVKFNFWLVKNIKIKMLIQFWKIFVKIRFMPEKFMLKPNGFEDYALSTLAGGIFNEVNVANPQEAMYFAFEHAPEMLFELTNNVLPQGCHGFTKFEFWDKYIPSRQLFEKK